MTLIYEDKNIREQYITNISALDRLITLFTGKPIKNQSPLGISTPINSLVLSTIMMISIPVISDHFYNNTDIIFAIVFYVVCIIQTGIFRRMQVEYAHHASHNTFVKNNKIANKIILNILSIVSISQNGSDYKVDHANHHAKATFTTINDADAKLLYDCGIRPGLTEKKLWANFLFTVISPKFHMKMILMRAKSAVLDCKNKIYSFFAMSWLTLIILVPIMFINPVVAAFTI